MYLQMRLEIPWPVPVETLLSKSGISEDQRVLVEQHLVATQEMFTR